MFKLSKLSVLVVFAVLVLLMLPAAARAQGECLVRPALDEATSLALYATPGSGVVITLAGDDAGLELPALAVMEDETSNWYKLDVSALSTINTTAWIRAGAVELMRGDCSELTEGEPDPPPDEGDGAKTWHYLLVSIAASLALFVAGVLLYNWWHSRNIAWLPDAVEGALKEFLYKAILSAYRLSERALDEIGERLSGADKKAIADRFYALIPDGIGGFSLDFIKRYISKERFEELIQQVFDEFYAFYTAHTGYFDELAEEWFREHQPDIHPPAEKAA